MFTKDVNVVMGGQGLVKGKMFHHRGPQSKEVVRNA